MVGCRKTFEALTREVNEFLQNGNGPQMTVEEIAMGFIRVANETMCRPIRNLTQGKGHGRVLLSS